MIANAEYPVAKKKKKTGRPPRGVPTSPIQLRLPDDLLRMLATCTDTTRRSRTQEIVVAIENHLKTMGLWPPPAEDAGDDK